MSMKELLGSKDAQVGYKDILKFYIPLAASSVLMMSSMNVVNSALSQTANPEIALAAYAVGISLPEMIAAPCFAGLQMLVTLGKDRLRFINGANLMLKIMVISLAVIGLLAFTPLGRWAYLDLFGAPESLFPQIKIAARWSLIFPISYTLMAASRSVLLIEKKTQYVTLARFIRIALVLFLGVVLPRLNFVEGVTVGMIIAVVGISTEGIITAATAIPLFRKWSKTQSAEQKAHLLPSTQREAFQFIWPLMITNLLWGVGKPLLNAGLSRTANPEMTIATYQVASMFAWLFIVLVEDNTKQVAAIFGRQKEIRPLLIRMMLTISIIVASVIALVALTPLSAIILKTVIGASDHIVANSIWPILILAVFPFGTVLQEYYAGLLLLQGNTKAIGLSKGANILSTSLVVFAVALIFPTSGAVAGAIAVTVGIFCDFLVLWAIYKKSAYRFDINRP